ncbi:hypothetical protein BJY14_008007 [Actinomadura luteofluorescens]|uniref:AbiJ-NTD3 domain-containing protein n=1 Tax=Actinomadura luteofluorescens TaxID=46163 RepID=A0A7Y9EQN3_9ACTN|nr:hypothetical protein [Actinomadura luteofluorescens]NYD52024.1 hypothetical protein [Actinomadura luteofluorescens]
MKPDDFFEGDGWHRRLDVTLLRLVRKGPLDGVSDLDAALGLTQLAEEGFNRLGNFGQRLDDGGIAEVLQSQRVVLRRLGIDFRFPFYDFRAFYRYCEKHQFATWDHLPLINEFFAPALERLEELNGLRVKGSDLPIPARRITEVTRRRIMESIRVTNNAWQYLNWTGSILTEIEFLDQIYDLDSLPSSDSRFLTARNDIYQHCINNPDDLPTDWIFHDWRFGLTDSDDHLLRFLAQMLHPEVRPDAEEVERLRVRFNEILQHDGYEIVPVEWISGAPVFGSRRIGAATPGAVKQLVFAADGPKPKIVLADLVSGDIRITENEQYCLVYDQPIKRAGLTWGDLLAWWRTRRSFPKEVPDVDVGRDLWRRLYASLHKLPESAERRQRSPEQMLFHTYTDMFPISDAGSRFPALVPQVYVHYDPQTRRQRGGADSALGRERMDFLLLLSHGVRVVVEVDGKQHYADGNGLASPRLYGKMVA